MWAKFKKGLIKIGEQIIGIGEQIIGIGEQIIGIGEQIIEACINLCDTKKNLKKSLTNF